jgi:hypothetical protein
VLALQTASELGSALFTLIVLALSAGVIGVVGSAIVRGLSDPGRKYRLLYVFVLTPAAFGAYAFLSLAELGPLAAAWFGLGSGVVADGFANFVEFLAAGVVWLTAYAPTVPSMYEARDIDRPVTDALRRTARYVLGSSAVLAIVVTLFVGAGLPLPV